jgi:hypothetical protein
MKKIVAAAGLAIGGLVVGGARDAGACSCGTPTLTLVTPDRLDAAPLNTKVRVDAFGIALDALQKGTSKLVLRALGGQDVAVKTSAPLGPAMGMTTIELTPVAPLAPSTRYAVAVVDAKRRPSTLVFGTFTTGTAADTTPPRLVKLGAVAAEHQPSASSASCGVPGPWVRAEGIEAVDPDRKDAQLAYAVWLGDAAGKIDSAKPPAAVVKSFNGKLLIGSSSVCDFRASPFPAAPFVWLGIAAVDEAGNASPVERVRVNLPGRAL